MKKTLTLLLIIASLGVMGQRFEKQFAEADSAFNLLNLETIPIETEYLSASLKGTGLIGDIGGVGIYGEIAPFIDPTSRTNVSFSRRNFGGLEVYNEDGEIIFKVDSLLDIHVNEGEIIITLEDLVEYQKECLNDTIVTTMCSYVGEYIWEHDGCNEMISTKQLHKLGYELDHIWVVSGDPWKCNAYFVKELTLKGFITWLKLNIK